MSKAVQNKKTDNQTGKIITRTTNKRTERQMKYKAFFNTTI